MAIYLYANSVMYLAFAAWVTLSPWRSAAAVGYEALSRSGKSEYLVVYGGLELGLAVIFAIMGSCAAWQRIGVILALCLYVPIVTYRIATVVKFWPVHPTTLWVGALEISLLLAAIGLLSFGRGAMANS